MESSPTFTPVQRKFFEHARRYLFSNPFTEASETLLAELLGPEFNALDPEAPYPGLIDNRERLCSRIERHIGEIDTAVRKAAKPLSPADYRLYECAVVCLHLHRNQPHFQKLIEQANPRSLRKRQAFLTSVWGDSMEEHFNPGGIHHTPTHSRDHLFALFFQLHRAEHFIHNTLPSPITAARHLRIRTWQSIFTRNLERYFETFHTATRSVPTLITGPVGSHKDRIAQVIGLSQYIPFDSNTGKFEVPYNAAYTQLDLAAVYKDTFDEKIFGFRRHSASEARSALDHASHWGALFLNNLHRAPLSAQARLTHLIHSGQFHFLDGGEAQPFQGKLIAASDEAIETAVLKGDISEDLYLAISADRIRSYALSEALREDPDCLPFFVSRIAQALTDNPSAQKALIDDAVKWIGRHISPAYSWPGNFRELEQCVRNIMIHGDFTLNTTLEHTQPNKASEPLPEFVHSILAGSLRYDELLHHYFKIVVEHEGGYAQASRQLGVDQRTVKKYYTIQNS